MVCLDHLAIGNLQSRDPSAPAAARVDQYEEAQVQHVATGLWRMARDDGPRTVDRILEGAGRRADFHRLQLERLPAPPEAVQLDELHGRVSPSPSKKGGWKACSAPSRPESGLGSRSLGGRQPVPDRRASRAEDLATAAELVASVAPCVPAGAAPPLLLVDNHLPYPSVLLQVFGEVLQRRRKRRRGRRKHAALKPPAGLLAGVVHKVREAAGNVEKVRATALFGRLMAIQARMVALEIGMTVNTSHLERLIGTMRCQQARLARRPRCVSRGERRLQWSLWLWRELYNWVRVRGSLEGRTPAMATGLSVGVW